ncbi:MAG: deoxyribose-phosphate aldolase [Bacteroidota bacterium]
MELASYIDHTILKADCTLKQIETLCKEAKSNSFAAVCVPPYYVKDAVRLLEESGVKVATVVGFPMGYAHTPAKVEEVKRAVDEGADEIDVVVNICAIKNGNWSYVKNDIESMTMAAHLRGKIVKIILETGLLKRTEIAEICRLCNEVGVDFVKTSTGLNGSGASVDIVRFLKKNLNNSVKICASGGIRDAAKAGKLVDAGAARLGSSSGLKLIK